MRVHLLKIGLVLSLVLLSNIFLGVQAQAINLSEFLWKNRLLLVFAPHAEDKQLQDTFKILELNYAGLEDRELVVIRSLASQNVGDPLRRHFNVHPDDFRIILIGKDGGPKDQTNSVIDICSIFGLIDAMPMRRQEMMLHSPSESCFST